MSTDSEVTTTENPSVSRTPPRPGGEPSISGVPVRRVRPGNASLIPWRTLDDVYDSRVTPMDEMP